MFFFRILISRNGFFKKKQQQQYFINIIEKISKTSNVQEVFKIA